MFNGKELALMLDFEGMIGARFNPCHQVNVKLTMRSPFYPIIFHEYFGGSLNDGTAPNGALTSIWELNGKACKEVLELAYPHLLLKKSQAQLALAFIETIKNIKVTDEVLLLREKICIAIQYLNKNKPDWETEHYEAA